MIIQVHTPNGMIYLDTEKNTEEDFVRYGLSECDNDCEHEIVSGRIEATINGSGYILQREYESKVVV